MLLPWFNVGNRDKIFIGTVREKAVKTRRYSGKGSYKNSLIPRDRVWTEVSNSEKVPIKIGLPHKVKEGN